MAVNVLYDKILTGIKAMLADDLKVAVAIDEFPRGGTSVRLTPATTGHYMVEPRTSGVVYSYNVLIDVKMTSKHSLKERCQIMHNVADALNRNVNYSGYYYDLVVTNIDLNPEDDPDITIEVKTVYEEVLS